MNLLIVGNPGSGKGTQADLLTKRLGLIHISSGQALREVTGPEASEIQRFMKRGELVPDDIVLKLVEKYLAEHNLFQNLIIDGSPRSLYQYEEFKKFFSLNNSKFDHALYINVSEEESIKRLTSRREHKITHQIYNLVTNPPGPEIKEIDLIIREDDAIDAVRERLRVQKVPAELLEAFKNDGILMEIDGERPVEVIFHDILAKLENGQK
jgi:adenylate kinase